MVSLTQVQTMLKKTLVLGASTKPERFSNKAMRKLLQHGHPVEAIGARAANAEGVAIHADHPAFQDIHTVTLYLNPQNQKPYYDYLLSLKPKRVVFNPGTENAEFKSLLQKSGIETIEHCTLIMLDDREY